MDTIRKTISAWLPNTKVMVMDKEFDIAVIHANEAQADMPAVWEASER